MNEQEVALHVASKLTGKLYVGQRIRTRVRRPNEVFDWQDLEGVITSISTDPNAFDVYVKLDGRARKYHFTHPETIIV